MSILDSIIQPLQQALQPDPGTTYGSVLPVKRDSQGNLGYALPSVERNALLGLLQAPGDLAAAFKAPGDVLAGTTSPSQGVGDMTKGLLWAAGGDLAVGKDAAAGAIAHSIPAYHGTPYTFEPVEDNPFGAFQDQKIGTGEGAQAYGYGHYVAGSPKVAESYKQAEDGNLYQVAIKPDEHELLDWDGTRSEQSPQVQQALAKIRPSLIPGDPTSMFPPHFTGNDVYQWLQDNHQRVRDQFGLPGRFEMSSPEVASKALDRVGVLGIKYLDAGSRNLPDPAILQSEIDDLQKALPSFDKTNSSALSAMEKSYPGEGEQMADYFKNSSQTRIAELQQQLLRKPTSNYVIFHPSNLTITHRNGVGLEPVEGNPFGAGQ